MGMRIVQGDVVESVRIIRVGAKAEAFHPTTESFRAMVRAAEQRVAGHQEKKRLAEQEWIGAHYPKAEGPAGGVRTERLSAGQAASGGVLRVRYRGSEVGQTPWSARDALVPLSDRRIRSLHYGASRPGAGCGRGRPPHHLCR